MKKKFDKHWLKSSKDDYSMLFFFVVILDPRYKLSFLKYCYESIFEDEIEASLKISDVRFKLAYVWKLSHLARDILIVPLTNVASESTFSIGCRILNKWKSSYIPENVEALITTWSWLFGYECNFFIS
ncbi:hypothetical protein GQ457_09G020040 [Hibiscus cannabinus]